MEVNFPNVIVFNYHQNNGNIHVERYTGYGGRQTVFQLSTTSKGNIYFVESHDFDQKINRFKKIYQNGIIMNCSSTSNEGKINHHLIHAAICQKQHWEQWNIPTIPQFTPNHISTTRTKSSRFQNLLLETKCIVFVFGFQKKVLKPRWLKPYDYGKKWKILMKYFSLGYFRMNHLLLSFVKIMTRLLIEGARRDSKGLFPQTRIITLPRLYFDSPKKKKKQSTSSMKRNWNWHSHGRVKRMNLLGQLKRQ